MEKSQEIQRKIDQTNYWDTEVLDFQINCFGDEVCLRYYENESSYWEVVFLTCYWVQYKTDATWRTIPRVKDMTGAQKGYYCQKIWLSPSKVGDEFIDVIMDLSIMDVQITCKEVEITQKYR